MLDTLEIIKDVRSSAQARAKRLKTARLMTGLTRRDCEEKYGVCASTIQSWEACKAGGLTAQGANRFLFILRKEGVHCTADWLLHGIGSGPQATHLPLSPPVQESHADPEDKKIIKELLTFRRLHVDAVDFIVLDDGMEPYYSAGDYVAGIRCSHEKIFTLIGMDCIVQTTENKIYLRRLKKGGEPNLYNLFCTNLNTTIFETTLYDQTLINAAPVIWHRRKNVN